MSRAFGNVPHAVLHNEADDGEVPGLDDLDRLAALPVEVPRGLEGLPDGAGLRLRPAVLVIDLLVGPERDLLPVAGEEEGADPHDKNDETDHHLRQSLEDAHGALAPRRGPRSG